MSEDGRMEYWNDGTVTRRPIPSARTRKKECAKREDVHYRLGDGSHILFK